MEGIVNISNPKGILPPGPGPTPGGNLKPLSIVAGAGPGYYFDAVNDSFYEEGMTWDEWVSSEYNTLNYYTDHIMIYDYRLEVVSPIIYDRYSSSPRLIQRFTISGYDCTGYLVVNDSTHPVDPDSVIYTDSDDAPLTVDGDEVFIYVRPQPD